MELQELIIKYSQLLHIDENNIKYPKLILLCKALYYKEITFDDFNKNLSQIMEWQ